MRTSRTNPKPASWLQSLAENISSATDPQLAAWQEAGLARRGSPARPVVWTIVGVAVIAGLTAIALGGWFLLRPALGLAPLLLSPRRTDQRAGLIILLADLVTIIAGAAAAFATFQVLSRVAYRVLNRPS